MIESDRIDSVADTLAIIALREEVALKELKDRGVEVSKFSLNYPSEQRQVVDILRGIATGMRKRPEVVCICGSSRFIDQIAVLAWEIEKSGAIALGMHLLPMGYTDQADHQAEHEGVADKMDTLHLRKIDMADRVIVVDVRGYIGDSTRREIAYAERTSKPVDYMSHLVTGSGA